MEFKDIEGKPDEKTIEKLKEFYASVFGQFDFEKFERRLDEAQNLLINLALDEDRIVGSKLGYRIAPQIFYSWIGGVRAEFRGRGIAAGLMRAQHDWCGKHGFEIVRTKTKNSFKPMLILNLKSGFDITKVYQNPDCELKIVLEKKLDQN
jgi:predicted GNAT superfamily acetyltransferase